jgi:acetyltransferase-like isoleucine patch superfamily enzyme
MKARTRYYRWRYRARSAWGTGVQVHGPLRLRGPGQIVIGDGCVLGGGSDRNFIHAAGPGSVRISDGCHLQGVDITATDNVTIGANVLVRERLRIEGAGRVALGDGCDVNALDIVDSGDVTIGDGVKVHEYLRIEGAGRVALGDGCKVSALNISATGDVTVGSGVNIRSRAQIGGQGRIVIGDRCTVESGGLEIHTEGPTVTVRIGEECGINGLDVYATDDVTIGDRCMVGLCSMATTDFHSTRRDRWSRDAPVKRGAITVGTNVWIASRTVITKSVSIGDNSVVSIGTVVRENVPTNVIVASHEQRIVKRLPRS